MKRLKLSGVDLLLLACLLDGPSYGYELAKRCRTGLSSTGSVPSSSQIYNSLGKLWRRGLILREAKPQKDSPCRQVYRLNLPKTVLLSSSLEEGIGRAHRESTAALAAYQAGQENLRRLQELAAKLTRACGTRYRGQFV